MSVRYISLYVVKGKNANAKGGEGFSFMILLMVDVTLLGCPTQFSNFHKSQWPFCYKLSNIYGLSAAFKIHVYTVLVSIDVSYVY